MQPSKPQQQSNLVQSANPERIQPTSITPEKLELRTAIKGDETPVEVSPQASAPISASSQVVSSPQGSSHGTPSTAKAQVITTEDLPADDVDVIEKEWVDRAENIIKTTAGDPYAEEQQEESLSKEYLKKRFNLDVEDS